LKRASVGRLTTIAEHWLDKKMELTEGQVRDISRNIAQAIHAYLTEGLEK
jgi:hypothetical protein